ncbi:dTDP-4-dehydrorhamnose reductase [Saccharothrix sp. ALI-22-I]|uniref:dTDP-4-dehydrorhamnose reductase n=1 Tax=Saccharothrix sp. ALI-22-I TaxID=1933778 RepID=UPI00097C1850|nr:dTDP-4-dehydrorhamnose reductase [Saccharothrix sp. ALI-22-I]ONI91582.1 dTDP-4-dehydrorhamnose reductase [Saccharothrix sp. ALI-22-I]
MKWLVTGVRGLLGSAIVATLGDEEIHALSRDQLDITDPVAVGEAISSLRPDVVINAAADKNADSAEKDDTAARAVNAVAPGHLADACAQNNALLVHISADYVFDGRSRTPYTEEDSTSPLSAYGKSKLLGEQAVLDRDSNALVVRTSWLYSGFGRNFVTGILKAEQSREFLTVVDDQTSSPTSARSFADALLTLARARPPGGVYHCTGAGSTTWFGLASAVFEQIGADPARLRAVSTESLGLLAPRPAYSVLANDKWVATGLPQLPPWQDDLAATLRLTG